MRIEDALLAVTYALRSKLNANEEPANDLINVATNALIEAELSEDKRRAEQRAKDKSRRLRNVVLDELHSIESAESTIARMEEKAQLLDPDYSGFRETYLPLSSFANANGSDLD